MPSGHSMDDSFDDSFSEDFNTIAQNNDVFAKLFAEGFEDEIILYDLSVNEEYPKTVLSIDNYCNRQIQSNDLFFDYISGLIHLIQKLSQLDDNDILQLWITSAKQTKNCILSTIFQVLPNCYPELCLPKFIDLPEITEDHRISFYERLTLNICHFIASLSPDLFQFVEPILFKQLLSAQSVCHLLASDVLCFTVRFSKSPLCYQFCSVLMQISEHMNDSQLPNITSFLNRLIPFLMDIELEYLIKDYDLFSYPKVWRLLNIQRVLSDSQTKDLINKFMAIIEEGKPLNEYNLKLLRNLLTTHDLDINLRQNLFVLFAQTFFASNEPDLYSEIIGLLTVLMPKELDDIFVEELVEKFDKIFSEKRKSFDLDLIENIMEFVTRLAQTKTSNPMESHITRLISSSIRQIYGFCYNFYAKYFVFKALENILTKTKYNSIIKDCREDTNLKNEFQSYLIRIKSGQQMLINNKIKYLQSIETKLNNQMDFNTSEEICRKNAIIMSQMCDTKDRNSDDSNSLIDNCIDSIEENIRILKENQTIIVSNEDKQRLVSVSVDLNNLIVEIKRPVN